jgi:hypothetical protein
MSGDAMHAPVPAGSGREHRFLTLPHSTLGKWAVSLFVAFWFFIGLFFLAVSAGARGSTWELWGTMIPAVLCGIGGLVTGVTSMVRSDERSLLVFVAVAWGTFVLWFVSMEIVFPH